MKTELRIMQTSAEFTECKPHVTTWQGDKITSSLLKKVLLSLHRLPIISKLDPAKRSRSSLILSTLSKAGEPIASTSESVRLPLSVSVIPSLGSSILYIVLTQFVTPLIKCGYAISA